MDISIELFLVVLTMAVFGLTFLTAFFSPIARKIGFRNIRRRIGNTALVVLGSMVGSALITGSLVLGDSLDRSFLNIVEENLGEIDVWVGAEDLQTNQGAFTTFTNTELEQATTLLEENARQDGVLPILNQVVTARKLNAQGETVLNAFIITMVAGDQLQLADFGESPQVFPNLDREEGAIVSSSFAKRLELAEGDTIAVTLGQEDVSFYVEHIYEDQGIIGVDTFFVNADYIARQLQLAPDLSPYNSIYVSHPGGLEPEGYDGDQYREDIIAALEGFESERIGLNVNEIKQSALDGFGFGTFITLFLVLSIFGIIAGILLIANLYSMLAEERKFEMGVLRAIALNRFQLTRSFVYEGLVYSLASSLLGVIVGVGLGIALTVGVNEMFSGVLSTFDLEEAFEIEFAVEANSLLIGFTVGALITFLTATFSSYLISKLNIVSAIRNIPEEAQRKLNFAWVVKSALILLLLISTLSLLATSFFVEDMLEGNLDDYSEVRAGEIVDLAQGYTFYLGVVFSLLVGAWLVARVSRMLSTKDLPRYILSVTALAVIIFTAFSAEIERVAKPLEYEEGLGIFFFVSLALVIASVILITFNLGILVKILDFLFGSIGKVKPVLLIALRYPASNHSRTGATLIMFGLIIYLIAFISIDKAFINDIFENTVDESLGGYDVQVGIGTVPDTSVIDEIREETLAVVEVEDAINAQEIEVGLPEYKVGDLEASFAGGGPPTDQSAFFSSDEEDIFSLGMRALPADFLLTADRDLDERAPGFETDAEVWQEVVNNPDVIVLGEEFASAEFQSSLPDLQVGDTVEIGTVFGGEVRRKTVIGKVTPGETAGLISFYSGVITSYEHVEGRFSPEYLARYRQAVMLVELKEGVDTTEAVNNIKRTLLDYDIFLIQSIDDILGAIQGLLNTLLLILQGYLAFSLVVGTSGLAIIMTRSVQERKQQIGMLRALGFQRRQILFSFFIESTLIVLIGLIIGISMAIIGMNQLITVQQRIDPDFQLIIPWSELAIIAGLVYAWALLFALVPSIRASRLSPVEATNYPE